MESAHLLVGGVRVASVVIATSRRERRRGLLGHDGYDGAYVLPGIRSVHTVGMRFAIDVAFARWVDASQPDPGRAGERQANTGRRQLHTGRRQLDIVEVVCMRPHRVGRPRRCDLIIETEHPNMEGWGLGPHRSVTIERDPTLGG